MTDGGSTTPSRPGPAGCSLHLGHLIPATPISWTCAKARPAMSSGPGLKPAPATPTPSMSLALSTCNATNAALAHHSPESSSMPVALARTEARDTTRDRPPRGSGTEHHIAPPKSLAGPALDDRYAASRGKASLSRRMSAADERESGMTTAGQDCQYRSMVEIPTALVTGDALLPTGTQG